MPVSVNETRAAAGAVARGVRRAPVEEPGEYRWVLERNGDDLQITILWFRECFSGKADAQGEVLFSARCKLRRFTLQLKHVLQAEIAAGRAHTHTPAAHRKLEALFRAVSSPDQQ